MSERGILYVHVEPSLKTRGLVYRCKQGDSGKLKQCRHFENMNRRYIQLENTAKSSLRVGITVNSLCHIKHIVADPNLCSRKAPAYLEKEMFGTVTAAFILVDVLNGKKKSGPFCRLNDISFYLLSNCFHEQSVTHKISRVCPMINFEGSQTSQKRRGQENNGEIK